MQLCKCLFQTFMVAAGTRDVPGSSSTNTMLFNGLPKDTKEDDERMEIEQVITTQKVTIKNIQYIVIQSLEIDSRSYRTMTINLHGSFQHLRVTTHSKIIIAAPDCHIFAFHGVTVVQSMWKCLSQTIHFLENSISVILLLLLNLTHEEFFIVKMGTKILEAWSRC